MIEQLNFGNLITSPQQHSHEAIRMDPGKQRQARRSHIRDDTDTAVCVFFGCFFFTATEDE